VRPAREVLADVQQIVQEFLLARKLYLLSDRAKMPWSIIEQLMSTRKDNLTPAERLALGSKYGDPQDCRMIQMQYYRHESAVWLFESLFDTFGGMPCSEPLDRVLALLGLADAKKTGKTLSGITDYNLTA
jgi:hypothetical protein